MAQETSRRVKPAQLIRILMYNKWLNLMVPPVAVRAHASPASVNLVGYGEFK